MTLRDVDAGRMEKLVVLAANVLTAITLKVNKIIERVAEMEDSHYGTLQDDINAIMQNVFGPQESEFLDGSESSEDSDSSRSSSNEPEGPNPEVDSD